MGNEVSENGSSYMGRSEDIGDMYCKIFGVAESKKRWEQAIHRSLLLPKEKLEYFARFNVEGLLRGDYQSRMNGYAVARQNGWMSANDIRELENLDRIPAERGGDLYLINGAMTKLEDAGIFAASSTKETEESK